MTEGEKEFIEDERENGFWCFIFGCVMLGGAVILYVFFNYPDTGKSGLLRIGGNLGANEIFLGFMVFAGLAAICIGANFSTSGKSEDSESEELIMKEKKESPKDTRERVKFKSDNRFRR